MGQLKRYRKRLGRLRKMIHSDCGDSEDQEIGNPKSKESIGQKRGMCGKKLDGLFSTALESIQNEYCLARKRFDEYYADGWELTFVGCCHDHDSCSSCKPNLDKCKNLSSTLNGTNKANDANSLSNSGGATNQGDCSDDMSAFTTQFNVTALVPSVRRAYVDLWDTIELSLLGYYDTPETEYNHHNTHNHDQNHINAQNPPRYPVPAIMRILRTSVLPELAEYLFFVVGFKPLAARRNSVMTRRRRRDGGVMGPMLARGLGGVRLEPGETVSAVSRDEQYRRTPSLGSSEPNEHGGGAGDASSGNATTDPSPLANNAQRNRNCRSNGACHHKRSHETTSANSQSTSATATLDEIASLRNTATTMSAWKLACILRERGVGCLRCAICDRIDLIGDDLDDEEFDSALMAGLQNGEGGIDESSEDDLQSSGYGGGSSRQQRAGHHHNSDRMRNTGRSPFLREFQKRVGGGEAWMTPCLCQELVHRQCLEQKMGLVPKYYPWEVFKLWTSFLWTTVAADKDSNEKGGSQSPNSDHIGNAHSTSLLMDRDLPAQECLAPRVWISYDNPLPLRRRQHSFNGWDDIEEDVDGVIAVDHMGRFRSPSAMCETCGVRFLRTVRLPRSKSEVIASSLADPISMLRAASTFVHFVLACAFLAACEGVCSDASCLTHRTLLDTPLGLLKWPTTGLNGFALAWWQLQQCCMLHIFFSRRFAAIVDRLWMGPISLFYCRLYFYFIVTSALLAASYIPMVSRTIRINLLQHIFSPWLLRVLQPIGDFIAFVNLLQYAIVSTTVICIFWRTNYRIFTVADGKEAIATLRRRGELARNMNVGVQAGGFGQEGMRRRAEGEANPRAEDARVQGQVENNQIGRNGVPLQRIVGVGAGDNNAWHTHPIYHGPW